MHEGHCERVGRRKELQGAGQPEEADVGGRSRHGNPQHLGCSESAAVDTGILTFYT